MVKTNSALGYLNRIVCLTLMLLFAFGSIGCSSIQTVNSLEQLTSTEDLAKQRSWFKQDENRMGAAIGMGMSLVLFPVAMVIANIPNYTDLTIEQIAEFSASATYEYNAIFRREWIAYSSGAWSPDYWIIGRGQGMKDDQGLKPVGLIYNNKKDNKAYYEMWLMQKDETKKQYMAWKSPVFKQKGDNLVYVLDDTLVLKKGSKVAIFMDFVFQSSRDGSEVIKTEKEIFTDFTNLYKKGGTMIPLQYCDGDRDVKKAENRPTAPAKSSTNSAPSNGVAD